MDRIVVTGVGCVSPLGTLEELWSGLVEGRSGVGFITAFASEPYKTRIAGQVTGFDPLAFMPQREVNATARCVQFGVAAARMAATHGGLDFSRIDPRRIGVYMGTSIGPLALAVEQHTVCLEKGISRVHPMAPAQNHTGVLASEISILLGIKGPSMTIASACTSGADALGIAMSQIRSGVIDVAIAGASEAPLFPTLFAAFDRLALMSRRPGDPCAACRPFSLARDGIVLSEGAGVCVLESEQHARSRKALMLAELAGFGATSDAYHHFQQRPEGEEAARAIEVALMDAKAVPDDVDYVSAHGTGTLSNDAIETIVIKRALGSRASTVPVSSIKSMTGHLMGACAALEAVACVKTLQDQIVPPTINLHERDPACDLDYVPNEARRVRMRTIVSNSFGFGSRNAALVFRSIF
ncbi:MAG: beta-ketoacyl-[acyl-carrier-protein] synthase family protein [Deltaproteobacteria bacterium]|nr:beta-ketoacyl-[acyl-carrier-protein] synthase family protein [Deltaproteobacteria bacterium]